MARVKTMSRLWGFLFRHIKRVFVVAPKRCGKQVYPRIVGGYPSKAHSHPWIASLRSRGNQHFCGGSVISKRHILTAAHCVVAFKRFPALIQVYLGAVNATDGIPYDIEMITIHPRFSILSPYDNDLAIVQVKQEVFFTAKIFPVCLPKETDGPPTGKAVVAGWGKSSEDGGLTANLMELTVPILPKEDCASYKSYLTKRMLCAGFPQGGKDSCQGDSGGPLVQFTNRTESATLIGIVSFGHGCARPLYPGLYTRLDYFYKWVLAKF
ncbi:uncharacterized protein LOC143017907 [Oratosquilla oratoria]|uniref:uncharacterized protein LOC143017907 n=1 Tax=Oratosquilla oratoria TaxID=337810 RepID=UPI003F7658C0